MFAAVAESAEPETIPFEPFGKDTGSGAVGVVDRDE